jgi:hypothetical protein
LPERRREQNVTNGIVLVVRCTTDSYRIDAEFEAGNLEKLIDQPIAGSGKIQLKAMGKGGMGDP